MARAFANKHQSLAEEIINMSFFFYIDANVGVMTLAIERVHFCLQRKYGETVWSALSIVSMADPVDGV